MGCVYKTNWCTLKVVVDNGFYIELSEQIVSLCVWHWHIPVYRYDVYNTIASVSIDVEFTCLHDNM